MSTHENPPSKGDFQTKDDIGVVEPYSYHRHDDFRPGSDRYQSHASIRSHHSGQSGNSNQSHRMHESIRTANNKSDTHMYTDDEHQEKSRTMWDFFNLGIPGAEIIRDIRIRAPYYISDWKDAWNYRVVPSTIYIYFANILPAIAFAQDMFDRTDGSYGLSEVLMASAMGGIIFGLFAGQPLCIVGVTGPITIFNSTVFEIVRPMGINFFSFMTWVHIWAFAFHALIALFNGVRAMKYVTKFSCDIFGCFINIIYIEKGIQLLTRQFGKGDTDAAAYFNIIIALCVFIFGYGFSNLGSTSFGKPWMRRFVSDYSLPLVVIFFTGFSFFPGRISHLHDILRLERAKAYQPTETSQQHGRHWGWFIHFWKGLSVGDVFLAIPFALLLTMLFYFDHSISSIMSLAPPSKIRKPACFHWDLLLLGITTFVAGILGIPAPNGLIPQAPLHTQSLMLGDHTVVEQRFTNTAQGFLTLGTMCGPLLIVLHLVPQGVLAGLFFMMGVPGLQNNELIRRLGVLLTEPALRNRDEPLYKVHKKAFIIFLAISAIGVAGEVAITQTIAAVGFPGVLLAFMVVGALMPRFFNADDISILDQPAASDFVMSSLDHNLRKSTDDFPSNEDETCYELRQQHDIEDASHTLVSRGSHPHHQNTE